MCATLHPSCSRKLTMAAHWSYSPAVVYQNQKKEVSLDALGTATMTNGHVGDRGGGKVVRIQILGPEKCSCKAWNLVVTSNEEFSSSRSYSEHVTWKHPQKTYKVIVMAYSCSTCESYMYG